MGCFLSKKQHSKPANHKCAGASIPAPPPPPEEEAVKEVVLSESPIVLKPTLIEDPKWEIKKEAPGNHELKVDVPAEITEKESTAEFKPCEDFISEVSEQSELCSYTESFSTTTTATQTAVEKRDDGEEVTQRSPLKPRRKRPNNGDMIVGARERNVRSPARRQAPSPEKRKPVQGRGMPGPRRNLGPGREVAARRSRSPVTRGNGLYKNPAGMNETGRAGGRSPARGAENSHRPAKAVENKSETQQSDGVPVPAENNKVEKQNDDNVSVGESLENPLVSLECFIFL